MMIRCLLADLILEILWYSSKEVGEGMSYSKKDVLGCANTETLRYAAEVVPLAKSDKTVTAAYWSVRDQTLR